MARSRVNIRNGQRVWATPDILPAETWLRREVEAAAAAVPLPRLLSGAQEWLIWRQCTADYTDSLELVARGALADGSKAL